MVEMIADEVLDVMGQRFEALGIYQLLQVPFADYLLHPQHYETMALALHEGHGLVKELAGVRLVVLH